MQHTPTFYSPDLEIEPKDDAILARAWDMLEVLKELRERYVGDADQFPHREFIHYAETWDKVDAILAQIKGE